MNPSPIDAPGAVDPRRSPWSDRNLRLLWAARVVSCFGDMLTFLALPMLVYEATGSTALLASTVFARGIPALLVGPFAGVLADRWDRRRVLVWSSLACAVLTVPPVLVADRWLLPTILVTVALKSVSATCFHPAMAGVLPALVAKERLLGVNAAFSTSFQTMVFLGPLAGSALAVHGGMRSLLIVDAATFVIAAVLLAGIALPALPTTAPATTSWRGLAGDIGEGLRWLRGSRMPLVLLGIGIVTSFGQGFITPAWLPYLAQVLHQPAERFGVLVGMQGLGLLLGSLLVMALGLRGRGASPGLYALFLAGSGTAILMQATTAHFSVLLAWGTLVGVLGAGRNVLGATLLQQSVPGGLMGRVSSAMQFVSEGAHLLAVLVTTLAGDLMPVATLFLVASSVWFVGCVGGAVLTLRLPRSRSPETA